MDDRRKERPVRGGRGRKPNYALKHSDVVPAPHDHLYVNRDPE